MRLSAADRTRPTVWDGLVALVVLAGAALALTSLKTGNSAHFDESGNFLTAEVVLKDETVARYDLNALTGPVELELDCPYPLTVEAEHGRIRILESACPGGDCVRTSWADTPGAQIICLPNRLIISLSGSGNSIDAVTG